MRAADIQVRREGLAAIVRVVGELDVCSVPRLRATLTDPLGDPAVAGLSLDLADVSFLDSTALGLFITFDRKLRERGGWLRLINPTRAARRVFEISGLDRTVTVAAEAS